MKRPANEANQRRYRVYFWLMDLSLFFTGIFWISLFLDGAFGIDIMPAGSLWGGLIGIPTILGVTILPTFLILARFMRDEYAELLWKRAAIIMAYILAASPLVLWVLAWAGTLLEPDHGVIFEIYRDSYTALYDGARGTEILDKAWVFFLVLFVIVFQFLRWKDSR